MGGVACYEEGVVVGEEREEGGEGGGCGEGGVGGGVDGGGAGGGGVVCVVGLGGGLAGFGF